jgi:hypothetical protein
MPSLVEESVFYSKYYAEILVYGCEVCNQMVNFRFHEESRSNFVFVAGLLAKACRVALV